MAAVNNKSIECLLREPPGRVHTDIVVLEKTSVETIKKTISGYPESMMVSASGGKCLGLQEYLKAAENLGAAPI